MPIEAKVICDSIGPNANYSRLHTQLWRYPKFVHQESLRHRLIYFEDGLRGDWDFSFSVSSARAIPFAKLLEEVKSDVLRAKPVKWGAEQKGMSPGDEIPGYDEVGSSSPRFWAEWNWNEAAMDAAKHAQRLERLGVHKSICNRIIEPFFHVNCLATATTNGWLNFLGSRLDSAADPTLKALAEIAWKVWNESQPQILQPGEWHLPFIEAEDVDSMFMHPSGHITPNEFVTWATKVSVARCARLSYLSFETGKRSTIEEDLRLYDRLVGSSPIHASPAEHQATPDVKICKCESYDCLSNWMHEKQAGNLGPGWRQYRKMLPGESLAPLPEGY